MVDQEKFYLNLYLPEGRQHVADVVVAHDLPMLAVARALAEHFRASLVYDSHELFCEQEFSRGEQRGWEEIERKHIGACERVITVNPSIARELEKRYALANVEVIHNAERVAPLAQRSRYLHDQFAIPYESRVLLFQGGFSAGRNLHALIESMALIRLANVHLVLLGEGQLSSALSKLIIAKSLQARVHIHPAVPQQHLLDITASADAGIIPYQPICLNNYYCTPNKLFEFIAAGLPVLASDLPELRRLVADNGIGQVRELGSARLIADAITDFFSDDGQLLAWQEKQKEIRQILSWQREGERLQWIYEGLK